jgi:hypothetical protein
LALYTVEFAMNRICISTAIALLTGLGIAGMGTALGSSTNGGWTIEPDTAAPSYAVVEPARTNLNIDAVVLACESAGGTGILQLQLYLMDEGPLQPIYPHSQSLKDDPRAEIRVDGQVFPMAVLFADDYVVLADAQEGPYPLLSNRLLDALQGGRTMTLRFDLLAEWSGPPTFDGEAFVELEAAGGFRAIAAMRRCAEADGPLVANGIQQ